MRPEYKALEIAPGTEYVLYVCKEMTAPWAGSVPVGPVPTVRLKSVESAGLCSNAAFAAYQPCDLGRSCDLSELRGGSVCCEAQ